MIAAAERLQTRRSELARNLGGGLVVLSANSLMQSRNDMTFPFIQESDFLYLSGIQEPDWILVYDGSRDHMWIVQPTLSDIKVLFDGEKSPAELIKVSGSDESIRSDDLEQLLRKLSRHHSTVYTSFASASNVSENAVQNPAQKKLGRVLERVFSSVSDCHKDIARLRSIKDDDEIAKIKKAVDLTSKSFQQVKNNLNSYKYEYEVEAEFDYQFRKSGAKHAYDPIIASGAQACTLHYNANNQLLRKGSAVLIDAGAELEGYCADISRTYVKGSPTKRYGVLHNAVAEAHKQILELIAPKLPVADYLRQVDEIMKRMMIGVGLIRSMDDDRYREYFPHSVSHGLGIDVHDSLGGFRTFEPGMLITVEPGLYIKQEGVGIRIEDDVLITASGHTNLSAGLSTDY